jgi:cytochrome c oxidase subunit 2
LALLACDPPPPPTSAPTPTGAAGLYMRAGCAACHTIDGTGGGLPGPDLRGLADRIAAERGPDAVEPFLRDSILDPDKEIAEGFQPGLMPPTYREALTEAEVDQLIDYLQALR